MKTISIETFSLGFFVLNWIKCKYCPIAYMIKGRYIPYVVGVFQNGPLPHVFSLLSTEGSHSNLLLWWVGMNSCHGAYGRGLRLKTFCGLTSWSWKRRRGVVHYVEVLLQQCFHNWLRWELTDLPSWVSRAPLYSSPRSIWLLVHFLIFIWYWHTSFVFLRGTWVAVLFTSWTQEHQQQCWRTKPWFGAVFVGKAI